MSKWLVAASTCGRSTAHRGQSCGAPMICRGASARSRPSTAPSISSPPRAPGPSAAISHLAQASCGGYGMPGADNALDKPVQLQARLGPLSQRVIDEGPDDFVEGELV